MLKQIMDYLKTNRRSIRKNIRSNYTRPIKDYLNYKYIVWMIMFHNFNKILFKLKNLKFIGFAVILFWLLRDFAFAADNVTNWINTAIEWLNWVMSVITFIVHPLVMFVWWLLSPDWTYGDIIWLRPVLYKMWTLVSNVVYVIFAFLLIAIAFLNVFKENTNMSIKNTLPRLIVWILIVPFTWLIVSLTLSVSNVLTASVISLPMDTISAINPATSDWKSILSQITIPSQIIIDITESNSGSKVSTGWTQLSLESFLWSQKWAYNLLPFYAYWIFKIDKIKNIWTNQAWEAIKKIWDVFKKLTFWTIFALIFTILVIALAFALFSRMWMLWLYAMFSPLFALSYFFSWSVKWWKFSEDIKKHFSIEKFISLAMVPVYVAAALSFGLMFLATAINFKWSTTSQIELTKVTWWQQDMKFWWFTLSIKWNYQDEDWIASWLVDTGKWLMDTGKWLISNIIISFIALMILWMAVMAALNANEIEIIKSAVQPFEQMWKSVWWLIKDSPKYIPIPWLPGWSVAASEKVVANLANIPAQIAATNASNSELVKRFWKHTENINDRSKVESSLRDWINWDKELKDLQSTLKQMISRWWTNDANFQAAYKQYVEKLATSGLALGSGLTYEKAISNWKLTPEWVAVLMQEWLHQSRKQADPEYAKLINPWSIPGNSASWETSDAKDSTKSGSEWKLTWPKESDKEINLKVQHQWSNIEIKLEKDTVIKEWSIVLKWDDKQNLWLIISWFTETEAKKKLKEIFKDTWVNIDKLYSAIIKQ